MSKKSNSSFDGIESNIFRDFHAFCELVEDGEENFKLCRKTVGKFHVMPDKNFI